MIAITAAYFLLMMVLSVSGFCDMDATGAIPPSEADNIPIEQCKFYIDLHGWPYYLNNPNNCSQFWECTVAGDICLFECQHCSTPSQCPETGALYFNPDLQYPKGPACDWPSNIECTNPWVTTTTTTTTTTPACPLPCQQYVNGKCQPECCEDPDCTDPSKPICNANGLCQDGCRYMTDCDGSNVICHKPWAQDPNNCEYCGNINGDGIGECLPGCIDNPDLCPQDYICDGNHKCKPECEYPCCKKGTDCVNYNTDCSDEDATHPDDPSNSCEYCTADDGTEGECTPGCVPENDMCINLPEDVTCAGDHNCQGGGSSFIKEITVVTKDCQGCSGQIADEGGAILTIIGTAECQEGGGCICATSGLDHSDKLDYKEGGSSATFSSFDVADHTSMDGCYHAHMVTENVTVQWNGPEGSVWYPEMVSIKISAPSTKHCTPFNDKGLTPNDPPIQLNCGTK